ncbi:hypothetical protein ACVWXO_011143 [Bradyrhizobium sp. LM2.7]
MLPEGRCLTKLANRDLKSERISRWNHKARNSYFRREPRTLFGHRDDWPSRRKDRTKLGSQHQIGCLGLLWNQVKIGSCHGNDRRQQHVRTRRREGATAMNGPFQTAQQPTVNAVPVELEVLAPPPLLLPGESREHHQALRQAIFVREPDAADLHVRFFADLAPRSAIEWLLAVDIAELSWEIQRYRVLRHQLLGTQRQQAIAAALRRIDLVGIAPEFEDEYYTLQNALSWRRDPTAASEIEARLSSYGFDQHAINVEVHAQARELFILSPSEHLHSCFSSCC